MRLTKVNGLNPNGSEWTPHFRELIKDVQVVGKKENATGTVFGILKDNYRNNRNIIQRDGIILDIDKSPKEVWPMLEQALKGYSAWIHTTWSHNPSKDCYCYRAIVETSETIQADDYESVAKNFIMKNPILKEFVDMGILDTTCKDKARFYYDYSISLDRRKYAKHRYLEGTPFKPIVPIIPTAEKVSSADSFMENIKRLDLNDLDTVYAGTGTRNKFEASVIGKLIKEHRNLKLVIAEALAINETKIVPPEPDAEIIRQCKSLWDKEIRDNPDFKPVDNIPKPIKRRTYTLQTMAELPPTKWLVEGLLIDKGIATIYGDSGSTKSFLAIDLAMNLVMGRSWFGLDVPRPIPVLYTALEGFSGIRKRCEGWVKENEIRPKHFYLDADDLLLGESGSVQGFIEHYRNYDLSGGVVIIDTFNMACPNINENDAALMGGIMKQAKTICNELDCSILIIHHAGKDESRGMRGSSSLKASMDTVIHVKQDASGGCSWNIEKLKDGKDNIGFNYRLKEIDITINDKTESTCTIDTLGEIKDKSRKVKLSSNQEACFRLIRDYLFKLIPDPVEDMEIVVSNCASQWTEHPSAKRTHDMRSAITKLVLKGLLDRGTYVDGRKDMIWLTEKGKNH